MKYIYALLCCCLLSCATETQRIDICYPDKGIKTSKIYKDYDTDYSIMITYNREGYPMKEEYTRLKQLYEYRYSNDTLLYTITTKLDRGDYPEGDPESDYVDTLFVRNFEKDPRRYLYVKQERAAGLQIEFTSVDCRKESLIVSYKYGKIQDIEMFKKDGIYSKVIAIYYEGKEKTIVVSNYINYKFDSHGHWIERTERLDDGSTYVEVRELEHY